MKCIRCGKESVDSKRCSGCGASMVSRIGATALPTAESNSGAPFLSKAMGFLKDSFRFEAVVVPDEPGEMILHKACPHCSSEQIVRVPHAYSQGLSHISMTSSTAGTVISDGALGGFMAKTHTEGTQQTALSKAISPPIKLGFRSQFGGVPRRILVGQGVIALVIFLALLILYYSTSARNRPSNPMEMAIIPLFISFVVIKVHAVKYAIVYNAKVLPRLLKAWSNSWLCNKCSFVFR